MKESEIKIHTNQLFEQNKFLYFCNTDYHGNNREKLGRRITGEFLDACERDNFIIPIHRQISKVKDQDGKEIEKEFKFYSAFQIFLVSEFMRNTIGEEGLLIDLNTMDLEYQKKQNTRYINWGGGMAFNIGEWMDKDLGHPIMVNYFRLVRNFHNFLKFLHSCEVYDDTKYRDYEVRRMYPDETPKIQYKFEEIKNLRTKLSNFNLSIEDVKNIYKNVGSHALGIDPMKHWYYYLQKHDQLRRDEISGLGGVAQELYNFCKIVKNLIETVDKKILPPFIEYIQEGFLSPNEKQISKYAEGIDVLVVKKIANEFLKWLKENSTIIDEAIKLHGNIQLPYIQNLEAQIQQVELFHTKYGDVRYTGNMRQYSPSKLKFEELDMYVKHLITSVHRIGPTAPLSEEEMPYEITGAIASRLNDLIRNVSSIAYKIRDILFIKIDELERQKPMLIAPLQQKYFEEIKGKENQEVLQHKFWTDILYPEQKKIDLKIEEVRNTQSRLYGFTNELHKVFCVKCRENKVVLHQGQFDYRTSNEAICDDCVQKEDLQKMPDGEWHCEHEISKGKICNAMLQKFAHTNILNTNLLSGNLNIKLNYGQTEVKVKCGKCKNYSEKILDWGWLP
jgi:hypothetical protein